MRADYLRFPERALLPCSSPNTRIGAKIFGAFVAMSAIIAVMGLAGYGVLSAAGNIAVTTFDGPLMAINYARAAQTDFTEMQMAELRFEQAPAGRARRHRRRDRRASPPPSPTTWTWPPSAPCAQTNSKLIRQIRPLVERWRGARARGDHRRTGKAGQQDRRQVRSADRARSPITASSAAARPSAISPISNMPASAPPCWRCCWRPASPCLLRSRIVRPLARRRHGRRPHRQGRAADHRFRPAATTRPARCSIP